MNRFDNAILIGDDPHGAKNGAKDRAKDSAKAATIRNRISEAGRNPERDACLTPGASDPTEALFELFTVRGSRNLQFLD